VKPPRRIKLTVTLLANGSIRLLINFNFFCQAAHYKNIVKLFRPYKNMYINLRKTAVKTIGEITYNNLGKNAYLPPPDPQTRSRSAQKAQESALIFSFI
jgi:hypothetical protein